MAILHRVRGRSHSLRVGLHRRLFLGCCAAVLVGACRPEPDPALMPDEVLQAELGLTRADIYRAALLGYPRQPPKSA